MTYFINCSFNTKGIEPNHIFLMPHMQKALKYKCDSIKGNSGGVTDIVWGKDSHGDREPSWKALQWPSGEVQRNPLRKSKLKQDSQ